MFRVVSVTMAMDTDMRSMMMMMKGLLASVLCWSYHAMVTGWTTTMHMVIMMAMHLHPRKGVNRITGTNTGPSLRPYLCH